MQIIDSQKYAHCTMKVIKILQKVKEEERYFLKVKVPPLEEIGFLNDYSPNLVSVISRCIYLQENYFNIWTGFLQNVNNTSISPWFITVYMVDSIPQHIFNTIIWMAVAYESPSILTGKTQATTEVKVSF